MTKDILRISNLRKSFGSVTALKNASFSVGEGEVVALLGDNGAGKSTLIKVISGVYRADSGEIAVNGAVVDIRSTRDAMALGIETIHQDSSLAPDLSIARNLFLGREPVTMGWLGPFAPINQVELREAARTLMQRVGISKRLNADAPVSTLSGGERQSIAISRAMQFAAKLIILDEPTNNLGVEETHGVLRFVGEMKAAGHSILFITHNIHHVFQVADRAVIMRRGEVVADLPLAGSDVLKVEGLIMGVDLKAELAHG
ncbi:ATP-binding cassette domain-containing protein [Cypionkella sp.]|uniref:ATP-binding cassette domain-containing protein n=1 Tax=Cypionkella sp. TaxID=2811411 RepID=UPI00262ECDAF|nr:ATP-binding cassette domain-containing protein [Cypionkella sp.]MDB5666193.1 sugar transporter ATP-binding protein [Cypionkella sp.]